ncbi:12606_t:CDS:1, partial [Dentiscutata erythropus]
STIPSNIESNIPSNILQTLVTNINITSNCLSVLKSFPFDSDFLKCVPEDAFKHLVPIIHNYKAIEQDPNTIRNYYDNITSFRNALCQAPNCSSDNNRNVITKFAGGCEVDVVQNHSPLVFFYFILSPLKELGLCSKGFHLPPK